jgi:hypothetical protein
MAIFFKPPAEIDDYAQSGQAAALRQNWHDFIAAQVRGRDRDLFYDESNDPAPGAAPARQPVPWNGFPRSIWEWFNADADPAGLTKAWEAAETLRPFFLFVRNGDLRFGWWKPGRPAMRRVENGQLGAEVVPGHRQQDEYCEWHADRPGGHITRICFTAEGPEYWEQMAAVDFDLVVSLYRQYVNGAVQPDDLRWQTDVACFNFDTNKYDTVVFQKGQYNPYNRWNTTDGAMHLTHPANTLGAEINLAADAAVLRPAVAAQPAATLPARLICCAGYGGVNRSSDPTIGAGVNGLAAAGKAVTLANPIGLYISTVEIGGLRDPNNVPIPQALRVRRASPDGSLILRAEVAPPAGAAYTLDQCKFGGRPLTFGGQIAQKITMVLFGLAKPIPGRAGQLAACSGKCCTKSDAPGFQKLADPGADCGSLTAADWAEDAPATPARSVAPADALKLLDVPAAAGLTAGVFTAAGPPRMRPASRAIYDKPL